MASNYTFEGKGAKGKAGKRGTDAAKRESVNGKKLTCGSTVFSTGHPRQYSLAPAMLVCADRTRRGMFIAVWPQMKTEDSGSFKYSLLSQHIPLCA